MAELRQREQQLQELYLLDFGSQGAGDRRLAWYGQKRAVEKTHIEAMWSTIEHFHMNIEPPDSLARWIKANPK